MGSSFPRLLNFKLPLQVDGRLLPNTSPKKTANLLLLQKKIIPQKSTNSARFLKENSSVTGKYPILLGLELCCKTILFCDPATQKNKKNQTENKTRTVEEGLGCGLWLVLLLDGLRRRRLYGASGRAPATADEFWWF